MWAPGAIGIAVSLIVLVMMKDSPEKCGFGPIASESKKKKPKPGANPNFLPDDWQIRGCLQAGSIPRR